MVKRSHQSRRTSVRSISSSPSPPPSLVRQELKELEDRFPLYSAVPDFQADKKDAQVDDYFGVSESVIIRCAEVYEIRRIPRFVLCISGWSILISRRGPSIWRPYTPLSERRKALLDWLIFGQSSRSIFLPTNSTLRWWSLSIDVMPSQAPMTRIWQSIICRYILLVATKFTRAT